MKRNALAPALVVTTLATLVLAGWAEQAGAALFVEFTPSSAPPGTTVTVATGGEGSLAELAPISLPAYLIAAAAVDSLPQGKATPGQLERRWPVTPIGSIRADAVGNGALRFLVPDLAPGRYVAVVVCGPCARHSAGRWVLPVGEFVVQSADQGSSRLGWAGLAGAALLIVVIAVAALDRRKGRRAEPRS